MPLTVNRLPVTTQGLLPFHLVAANSTNATTIAIGQRQMYGWAITNTNAAARYICFHDVSSIPTAGLGIYFKYGIPASGASNQSFDFGIQFVNGLSITTVVNPADNDATAVAASDLIINIFYR